MTAPALEVDHEPNCPGPVLRTGVGKLGGRFTRCKACGARTFDRTARIDSGLGDRFERAVAETRHRHSAIGWPTHRARQRNRSRRRRSSLRRSRRDCERDRG